MIFKEPKQISVYGTAVVHSFASLATVAEFAERQEKLWSPLAGIGVQSVPVNLRTAATEQGTFYGNLKDVVAAAANEVANGNEAAVSVHLTQVETLLSLITNGQRLTSESFGATAIVKVAESDPVAATYLVHLSRPTTVAQMGQFNGGVGIALMLRSLLAASALDTHKAGADIAREQFDLLVSSMEAHNAAFTISSNERDAEWSSLQEDFEKSTKSLADAEDENRLERQSLWQARQEQIEEEWVGIKRSLDERVTLAAPTDYWRQRATTLTQLTGWFAIAFGAVIAVFVLIFFTQGVPYLHQISTAGAAQNHVDVILLVLPLLIPAFCGIWILRILGRLLTSYLRLSEDARERKTMVETFLALSKEGADGKALLQPEDRHLILKALFRPGDGGNADDSPPVSALEQLAKLAGQKG